MTTYAERLRAEVDRLKSKNPSRPCKLKHIAKLERYLNKFSA
jgi:hypothetical protein